MVNQAAPGPLSESAPLPPAVLVLVRGGEDTSVARGRMEVGVAGWSVAVRCLPDDNTEAAIAAEEAIRELAPAIVFFVGAALAAGQDEVGEVLVADRVARYRYGFVRSKPRRRTRLSTPRRSTRRADPNLVRHARAVCEAGRWRERAGADARARLGSLVIGSEALAAYTKEGAVALERGFEGSLGLDLSGWDFTSGLYDDEELPAIAIYGLCGSDAFRESGDRAERDQAVERAAAFAAELLSTVTPDALWADPLEALAQEGESEHLRGDSEVLAHKYAQSFVQRPFLNSSVATSARGQYAGTSKERVGSQTLHALIDTAGSPDKAVLPPDLTIWVRSRDRGNALEFLLNSGSGDYHLTSVGETQLSGEFGNTPEAYRAALKARVRDIAANPAASDADDLKRLGNRVYDDLFPDDLKEAYNGFRESVKTLLITSDEPWIPWELVRPYGEDFGDDDFLCTQFAMTRWLRGKSPRPRFKVESLASLEAGAVDGEEFLASAKDECNYLISLADSRHVTNLSPSSSNFEAVKKLLDQGGKIHLWHVAAHGNLGRDDPNDSYIVLTDRLWRAGDMAGLSKFEIQKTRPLVFFNACLVAQQDYSLGRLGGWPAAWIEQNSCGGFVAPQWSVSSNLAAVFARAFYDAVVGDAEVEGQTLGEAARKARLAVREQAPLDPAWLSYAVYGHPNAEVVFGTPEHAPAGGG